MNLGATKVQCLDGELSGRALWCSGRYIEQLASFLLDVMWWWVCYARGLDCNSPRRCFVGYGVVGVVGYGVGVLWMGGEGARIVCRSAIFSCNVCFVDHSLPGRMRNH